MADVFDEPNQSVSLATKHGKQRAIRLPFRAIGFNLIVPENIETDALGTFTGEVERQGDVREVLLQKARLGMKLTELPRGIASEGSFAPHPLLPFVAADYELMVFIDDEKGFQVIEQIVSTETNFSHIKTSSVTGLKKFLRRAGFPKHAVIARPNDRIAAEFMFKGLQKKDDLIEAFEKCRAASNDGIVHIETDMRAHLNPTRMKIIRRLAIKLARRLSSLCPQCQTPGFGLVDVERGLQCALCGLPTQLVRAEIHGCPKCEFRAIVPLPNAAPSADPTYCGFCNP